MQIDFPGQTSGMNQCERFAQSTIRCTAVRDYAQALIYSLYLATPAAQQRGRSTPLQMTRSMHEKSESIPFQQSRSRDPARNHSQQQELGIPLFATAEPRLQPPVMYRPYNFSTRWYNVKNRPKKQQQSVDQLLASLKVQQLFVISHEM